MIHLPSNQFHYWTLTICFSSSELACCGVFFKMAWNSNWYFISLCLGMARKSLSLSLLHSGRDSHHYNGEWEVYTHKHIHTHTLSLFSLFLFLPFSCYGLKCFNITLTLIGTVCVCVCVWESVYVCMCVCVCVCVCDEEC